MVLRQRKKTQQKIPKKHNVDDKAIVGVRYGSSRTGPLVQPHGRNATAVTLVTSTNQRTVRIILFLSIFFNAVQFGNWLCSTEWWRQKQLQWHEGKKDETTNHQNYSDLRRLNILFVHQNFPGQFQHVAPALVQAGHTVKAFHLRQHTKPRGILNGVELIQYSLQGRASTPNIHPWLIDLESKLIRGQGAWNMARQLLQEEGYSPDIIVAHPGWGESLFLKDVWPNSKLGIFGELYYLTKHVHFDQEFDAQGNTEDYDKEYNLKNGKKEKRLPCQSCRLRIKNWNHDLHFPIADRAISPMHFQANTFPSEYQDKVSVIFDGIDTQLFRPNPDITVTVDLKSTVPSTANSKGMQVISLSRKDEVITYVSRNLEPYRGFHIFMRALPELLRRRPNARVLIVGGNGRGYGKMPNPDHYGNLTTWREVFTSEIVPKIPPKDWNRIHFLGRVPQSTLIQIFQLSTVHIYWTVPFVLSWGLLEAMSVGCAVVGSDTEPMHEVIEHGVNGRLVDYFDVGGLVEEVHSLLDHADERHQLGANARESVFRKYDLNTVCLPKQLEWVYGLASE